MGLSDKVFRPGRSAKWSRKAIESRPYYQHQRLKVRVGDLQQDHDYLSRRLLLNSNTDCIMNQLEERKSGEQPGEVHRNGEKIKEKESKKKKIKKIKKIKKKKT